MSRSVLVIGGGVIGLATARELLREGLRVTLVERGAPGREASWAGGGILSPLHPWRYPESLLELARWSQHLFPEFVAGVERESGIDPQWQRNGLLILDDEEIAEATAWGERWRMPLEILEGEALRRCEPALAGTFQRGIFLPEIGQIRNPRLLKALQGSVQALGGEIIQDAEVIGFRQEGGELFAVITPTAEYSADLYVVAGGAWTGDLLKPLGISLPITPVMGQMLLFRGEPGAVNRIVLKGPRYLIPRRDGRVLVGSTIEQTGFDKEITRGARIDLTKAGRELVPAIAGMTLEHHWAGLRPGSPGGVPFIGVHPNLPNLFVSAGHFRNGLMLAAASATLLRELVTGSEPGVPCAPYRLDRNA